MPSQAALLKSALPFLTIWRHADAANDKENKGRQNADMQFCN
jgi:hypothetical protein